MERVQPRGASWTAASQPNATIAVCLVGYARTLVQPSVYTAIASAIRTYGASDLFVVIATDAQDTYKGADAISSAALTPARQHLGARSWLERDEPGEQVCGLPCTGQFRKFEVCSGLVKDSERQRGTPYTWVIKARPDAVQSGEVRSLDSLGLVQREVTAEAAHEDALIFIPRQALEPAAHNWRHVPCTTVPPRSVTKHWTTDPKFWVRTTQCPGLFSRGLQKAGWPVKYIDAFNLSIVRATRATELPVEPPPIEISQSHPPRKAADSEDKERMGRVTPNTKLPRTHANRIWHRQTGPRHNRVYGRQRRRWGV